MAATANQAKASIVAIMGSTGSGKTTKMQQLFTQGRAPRTFAWSPKEYADKYAALFPGSVVVRSAAEFLAICREAGERGSFHVVFEPTLNRKRDTAQFNACCLVALKFGRMRFLADELHTVTMASGGSDGWSKLVMMGRSMDIKIIAGSQRPASIDKDFLGNCSHVISGRLAYEDDAKAVAKALNVRPDEVMALTGYSWLSRDMLAGKNARG